MNNSGRWHWRGLCVVSDGGVAGVQNDDPRLPPPPDHSTRRPASVTGTLTPWVAVKWKCGEKKFFHLTTGQNCVNKFNPCFYLFMASLEKLHGVIVNSDTRWQERLFSWICSKNWARLEHYLVLALPSGGRLLVLFFLIQEDRR